MDPIIQVVVEMAGKAAMKEVDMLYGVKEEVEEMKMELQWMQSFLEDADHHITSQSQQRQTRVFRLWVSQVREASLDAEDIVDTYLVKLALRKRSGVMNRIKRYACIVEHGLHIHAVASEIEAVKSRLTNLRMRLQTYGGAGLRLGAAASSTTPSGRSKPWQSRSSPHIHDRNVVGLDQHIDEVVDMLLRGGENEPCLVVSIHGMGGLGKTTLAKKVYGHERVVKHFDKTFWVYVSQQFNRRDVWKSILVELTSLSPEKQKEISKLNDEQLAAQLSQVLRDHKYLVVLDDIWSIEAWEELNNGFQLERTSRSKILFTTRKSIVAEHANRNGSYGGLKPLSDEKSLELLRKIALEGRDHEIQDLKSVENSEKEMLRHCGGLPLAIVVLGGILATKDSLIEWQTVHDNVNAYLRRGKGCNEEQGLGVHHVLAYSYYDLPSQLKSCFLYLSQFPEDWEIETKKLMRMWMAEGFVSVEYDGEWEETMEDLAETYLKELVGRCVVEVGKKGSTGRIKTIRLHDLMREVCLSKAREENFIHNFQREETKNAAPKGKIRRLSVFRDANEEVSLSSYRRSCHIRSLIVCYHSLSIRHGPVWADGYKLLRMLLLEGIDMARGKKLVKEIGKLIHLKHLSFRKSWIYDFPSMDKLGCMETLDLRVYLSRKSRKLGKIWKMTQLRHIYLPYVEYEYSTVGENVHIDEAKPNVQTLVNFPSPNCDVRGILNFPNLRKLGIKKGKHLLEFWKILNENSGFSFSSLHSFSLAHGSNDGSNSLIKVDIEVLFKRCPNLYKVSVSGPIEKFPQLNQFPNKLTKLVLMDSRIQGPEHIESTLGNLPNLRILELSWNAFIGEQLSFKKGTFRELITLQLQGLHELNRWEVEKGAMPILEYLLINGLIKLATLTEGLSSTLNKLEILGMPAQFTERLKEGGADYDKVKRVPSVIFEGN